MPFTELANSTFLDFDSYRNDARVPGNATPLASFTFNVALVLDLFYREPANSDVHIPGSLDEALKSLEADSELCDALGAELVTAFTILKRAEWERYLAATSDPTTTEATPWEIEYYLPFY